MFGKNPFEGITFGKKTAPEAPGAEESQQEKVVETAPNLENLYRSLSPAQKATLEHLVQGFMSGEAQSDGRERNAFEVEVAHIMDSETVGKLITWVSNNPDKL